MVMFVFASPVENKDIFYAAIGGYGGIGVILEVTLELAEDTSLVRVNKRLPLSEYKNYFDNKINTDSSVVFHNSDIYPKKYQKVNAVSWMKTDLSASNQSLQEPKRVDPISMYILWAISKTPFGKWRREHLFDRLLFMKKVIHTRNYEAGYNVAELNPISGKDFSWVLQEYFIPVRYLEEFVKDMAKVFNDFDVNVLNVSIRHAEKDPGTLLSWAKEEVFAFVVYYRQQTDKQARNRVAVWTRALIDVAIKYHGAYYLPYQLHATQQQLYKSLSEYEKLF